MRLIDADELKLRVPEIIRGYKPPRLPKGEAEHIVTRFLIGEAPTIDAVPVVRCGECKYYKSPVVTRDSGICAFANRDELTEPANYCSRGAKMEVEHDNA